MFTQVLRSEWTKLRSVRSTWWLVAVAVVLTAGIGVAVSAAAAGQPASSALPAAVATRSALGTILAQLALGTLAVLLISGEYGSGMIRTSMAVVPRRIPVLAAKIIVYVALVLPVTALTSLGTFLVGQVAWRSHSRAAVSLGDPQSRGSCLVPRCI
jgi:ABC-2 type transport system permease protein